MRPWLHVHNIFCWRSIEPLIGGLIHIARLMTVFDIDQLYVYATIEPLIGGLKCSFAFLERGAVEELFTGLECGE